MVLECREYKTSEQGVLFFVVRSAIQLAEDELHSAINTRHGPLPLDSYVSGLVEFLVHGDGLYEYTFEIIDPHTARRK